MTSRPVVIFACLFATTAARQGLALPEADGLTLYADLEAHLLPGQYLIEAYVFDLIRGAAVCVSAPAHLVVSGRQDFAAGQANLGGRLALVEVESPIPAEKLG